MLSGSGNAVRIAASGTTPSANFDFKADRPEDIRVRFITDADPYPDWLSYGVDYGVTLSLLAEGGEVTFTPALEGDGEIEIERVTPRTQMRLRLSDVGRFPALAIEGAIDRLTMLFQEADGAVLFARRGSKSEADPWPEMPGPAARANGFDAYDADGVPIIAGGITEVPLTPVAVTLVQQLTQGLMRTLGLGMSAAANVHATLTDLPARFDGRLTLTSGAAVMPADVLAATSVYYTPHVGNVIDIYDGTQFIPTVFGELTLALSGNGAHAGYHQSGKNFDLFVVDDGGVVRLGTGPAWTDDATRAAALTRLRGRVVNNAIMTLRYGAGASDTLSIAANRATHVGVMRASANGQCEWTPNPAAAAGGSNNKLFLRNRYHRVLVYAMCRDSTDSWTYTTLTPRPFNGGSGNVNNRIAFVADEAMYVSARAKAASSNSSASIQRTVLIGVDSTSAHAGLATWRGAPAGDTLDMSAEAAAVVAPGYHYLQMLENSLATGTCTWYGDAGIASTQAGLIAELEM